MNSENVQQVHKPVLADWICVAALCLLVSLVYLPQLFAGRTAYEAPEMVDVSSQWFPGYQEEGRQWRGGEFPLWYWHEYSGLPMLAYSHGGILYPPNIALLTLLDFPDAATLLHFLHALVAALGAYLLLRSLGVSSLASFLASITFALTGFFFFFQSQLSNHATTAWVPLLLYAVRRLGITRRAGPFVLTAGVTATMVLAGDTEGFIYDLIMVFFFILLYVRRESPGGLLRMLFLAGCALGLGMAMGSPLILSLMEAASRSVRSKSSPFQLDFGAMLGLTRNFYHIFFPFNEYLSIRPGNAYNSGLPPYYIGLAPVLILPYAFETYRRDKQVAALLNLAAVMALFLAVRKAEFLAPVVSRIPVLGQLGTVERTLALIQLAWLMAAAAAFDRFRAGHGRRRLTFMGAVLLLWALANIGLEKHLAGGGVRYAAGAVMLTAGVGALWAARKRVAGAGVAVTAVALVLGDVYLLALGCVPRTDKNRFKIDPAVQAFLDRQDPEYRFISFEQVKTGRREPEVAGMICAHSSLGSPFGIMRLPDWRYFEFLHLIDRNVIRDWLSVLTHAPKSRKQFYTADLYNPDFLSDKNLPLIEFTAAKFVFSRGISFKFSSPYSLMNEPDLLKEEFGRKMGKGSQHWMHYKKPRPIGQVDFRLQGKGPDVSTELPQVYSFVSYIYPGSMLALELAPVVENSGSWKGNVRISGKAEGQEATSVLYSSSVEAKRGESLNIAAPLEKLAGSMAELKIELDSDQAGAKTLVIDPRVVRPTAPFQRVWSGPIDIFINTRVLPRSFIVHEARSLLAAEERMMMTDPSRFDPGRMVLFEKGEAPEHLIELAERGQGLPGPRKVETLHRGGGMLWLRTPPGPAGWLFVSDTLFPGWKVFVDGIEQRIYRADLVFRAVFLTGGEHEVRFAYEPIGFRVGLWFGLVSLLAGAGIGFMARAGRGKRAGPDPN